MKTIFLVETHPVNKSYFSDVHVGWINETNSIEEAQHFTSYEEANKVLTDILTSNYSSKETLYLSIVHFEVKK